MNHFDAVDFSECHSEEVMFLLTLSVVGGKTHSKKAQVLQIMIIGR